MRNALLCFVALILVTAGLAQAPPSKPAQNSTKPAKTAPSRPATEDARIADIQKLLALTGTRSMVNQMKATLMEQFKQTSPNLPPEMFNEMLSEMKAEDLEQAIIPIYLKHFSAAEIKQLIAFYESPFGKKVTREMPQIIDESNEAGMNWGQNVVVRIASKWHKDGKLTDREYEQLVGPEEQPH